MAQALLDAGFKVQKRACVADEHYVPTLLAVHGLDNQARPACLRASSRHLCFAPFAVGLLGSFDTCRQGVVLSDPQETHGRGHMLARVQTDRLGVVKRAE